jgi:uncharacterized protein YicC (UPF0701 family)
MSIPSVGGIPLPNPSADARRGDAATSDPRPRAADFGIDADVLEQLAESESLLSDGIAAVAADPSAQRLLAVQGELQVQTVLSAAQATVTHAVTGDLKDVIEQMQTQRTA